MGFFFLIVVGILIWALARNPLDHPRVKAKIFEVNKQWGDFIAGYHRIAKNDAERAITERMLRDLAMQGMPVPNEITPEKSVEAVHTMPETWALPGELTAPAQKPAEHKEPLDNTSILLYFGAFLLVAAAGLFVGFGGAAGGVRTFIIAMVAALFYCVGFWLWYDRPKLKQAALTFIGIGIVLAPLAGVAAYNYVFYGSGPLVWFVTSAVCLVLYAHAVSVIRHPLLEYVLIGAFVSLFESSVAVLTLPAYYYAWGLAAAGLIIQVVQLRRKQPLLGDAPSALSANILLPLSLFVSLNMVAAHGTLQLAVALLVAAVYYGLVGWQASGSTRLSAAVAAESLFLAAGVFFGYSVNHDFAISAVVLMALAIPQVAWLWTQRTSDLSLRTGTVLLSSIGLAVLLGQGTAAVSFAAFLALAAVAAFVWIRQARVVGYVLGVIGLLGATLVGVYWLWSPFDTGFTAATSFFALVLAQLAVFYLIKARLLDTPSWRMWFQGMMVTTALAGIFAVLGGNGNVISVALQLVLYTVLVMVSWVPLVRDDDASLWTVLSGVAPFIPVMFLLTFTGQFARPGLLLTAMLVTIAWNVALSAWKKHEHTRAFAAVGILLLPVAIYSLLSNVDGTVFYVGAYSMVMSILLGARFFAVHRFGGRSQGVSYSIGAAAAALITLSTVPFAHSRLLSATTALAVAVLVIVAAHFIEKLPKLMAVLPFVVQIGLWSTYMEGQFVAYTAVSALIAALGYYGYATSLNQVPHSEAYYVHYASLVTSYIAVVMYIGAVELSALVWTLPWSVLLASITTLHALWQQRQEVREWAGSFVAIGLMLVLHYYGLRNVQIYAHVLAALFALYAYWRWRRGEHATSDSYVVATLAAVTIPLVLQALGGVSGDLYGWWLLIEQVAIMLLGMLLKKKLMIRWGLYVALGAVLYQLRDLGWAALAVLAVFLIGLALFRLQRNDHPQPPKAA